MRKVLRGIKLILELGVSMSDTSQDEEALLAAIEDHDLKSLESLTYNRDGLWGKVMDKLSQGGRKWATDNLPEE